jgi:hypothetical protein
MQEKAFKVFSDRIEYMKTENATRDKVMTESKNDVLREFSFIHNKMSERINKLEI